MTTTSTPAQVAAQATIPDAINKRTITLLGLFTTNGGGAALLRAPNGRIARVTPGSQVFGVTVTAIDQTQLMLVDATGKTFALRVPGH